MKRDGNDHIGDRQLGLGGRFCEERSERERELRNIFVFEHMDGIGDDGRFAEDGCGENPVERVPGCAGKTGPAVGREYGLAEGAGMFPFPRRTVEARIAQIGVSFAAADTGSGEQEVREKFPQRGKHRDSVARCPYHAVSNFEK